MTDDPKANIREARWPADAELLRKLRASVFIAEQGVPEDIEWDGRDAQAQHVLMEVGSEVVGCGRLLPDGRIGRLAVMAEFRSRKFGRALLQELIALAMQRGQRAVYLHAQADAATFYEQAGFERRGKPFDEAGIEHIDMHLALDYRDWNQPLTGVSYPLPFDQLAVAQARHAGREIRILSPKLDPRVFDQRDLGDALRRLLRHTRMSRVQILVQDARAITQRGHGLLQLARRLPSSVEMRRLAEHADWRGDTLMIRDRDSLLALPASETDPGFYRPNDRARCETALGRFDELWRAGVADPEFRSLAI
jgi:predicted GNAT family N-acyltransferase